MKKENKKVKKNINLLSKKQKTICYICVILFVILTILVFTKVVNNFNVIIESFVIGLRTNKLTRVMKTISDIARAYSLISISILLLFIIRNKKVPLAIIVNLIVVFLSSQLFKFIFKLPRPDGEFLVPVKGYGYPSGHAMVSLAYFSFLAYLILKKTNNKLLRTIILIMTPVTILLIGFSRIYLGVHYFSDVIAGYLLGTVYLIIYVSIIDKTEVLK